MTNHRALDDDERLAWFRLARTENVGPSTFAALLARFGTARAALEAVPRLARRGGKALTLASAGDAARELESLTALGGRLLCYVEGEFPPGLAALDPPPPVIAALGHSSLLAREMIAIVGARNASALGAKLAGRIAKDLGSAGLVVVSGLARGIDFSAHQGALQSGTAAVLASGIDLVYPPENQQLYDAIRDQGVLISEMAIGMAPLPRHFPRRNRLISGLARGVIVIEAAEKSGSLITAGYALEQGREVFAVPGSPLDPRARGANRLIREGATLTETAEDVLNVLRPILGHAFGETEHAPSAPPADAAAAESEADRIRAAVEEKLGPAPVEVDELVRQLGATPAAVLTVLLELELAGRIERQPGNRVVWR
ncbi:MAG: DNA-processing protein DprA [Alphaproteobacteria bacterium]